MRIATYNINGITARLDNLLGWLKETQPDIACLQELKSPDDRFPAAEQQKERQTDKRRLEPSHRAVTRTPSPLAGEGWGEG